MIFEWDPAKAAENFRKHKVSFDEAATVFGDPISATFADPDHSEREYRYITVGLSNSGRCSWFLTLLVVSAFES
ncbi:MAG TPA: BrnT family toxin [Candidatus Limnocylindrales bacterium]|nr:BrnT family toxin [Candidatus Limnocylindrales bacterium]